MNQDAYAEIFEAERPKLLRLAIKILKDEAAAEDAVSDTYLKGWQGRGGFHGGSFPAWLTTILKNTALDASRRGNRWATLDAIGKGTSALEDRDKIPDKIISDQEGRIRAEANRKARADFLDKARRQIREWTDPGRIKHGLRIASDPRVETFLDALAASAGRVGISQFVLVVRWAADCSEPLKEPFTREEARATVKVLEYFGKHFHGSPAGSGYEGIPEATGTLIRLLHPVANRKGTKTTNHQYDLIMRLDRLFRGICGPRKPADKAARILLEIVYGGTWNQGKLVQMKKRARKEFRM
jgi:RNA polymerase sigma factor (sigma-70 family)